MSAGHSHRLGEPSGAVAIVAFWRGRMAAAVPPRCHPRKPRAQTVRKGSPHSRGVNAKFVRKLNENVLTIDSTGFIRKQFGGRDGGPQCEVAVSAMPRALRRPRHMAARANRKGGLALRNPHFRNPSKCNDRPRPQPLPRIVSFTCARPPMPISLAAAFERSMIRPPTKGPRSLMRTMTVSPLLVLVTLTRVPNGNVL